MLSSFESGPFKASTRRYLPQVTLHFVASGFTKLQVHTCTFVEALQMMELSYLRVLGLKHFSVLSAPLMTPFGHEMDPRSRLSLTFCFDDTMMPVKIRFCQSTFERFLIFPL